MDSKDKQIEEMAKVIARRSTAFRNPNVAFMTTATKTAESLYTAGYRKDSEVIEEVFAEIERFLVEKLSSINAFRKKGDSFYDGEIHALELLLYKNAELKKKYTEEKNGTNN